MPFGNITTLYLPITANAGASQWGTNVRKLLSTADATSDATTITNHGTAGANVVRTAMPYATNATDATEADYGWAITPTDMGGATGARRFYPAGDHVATLRLGHNGTVAVNNATITMYVYRVGTAGASRARTLLASGTSAAFSYPATSGQVTATVTVAVPEVVFDPDQTIQYSFEVSAIGAAVVGRTATLFTGTTTAVPSRIDTPKLGVLADTDGTAAGSALASGVTGKVLGTNGSSAGTATATGTGASRSDTTGTAAGSAVVAGLGSSVAGAIGAAAGSATVAGQTSIVLGTVGTSEVSSGGGSTTTIFRPLILED